MKKQIFDSIINDWKQLLSKHGINQMKLIINELCEKYAQYDVHKSTMYSLIGFEYRKETKKNPLINLDQIIQEWNETTTILQLAQKYNVCAFLLARHLVNQKTQSKDTAKKWMKDPNFCDDGKLAYELMEINLHETMNGIFYNQMCLNSGMAFENHVRLLLQENQISFMTEDELRDRSYDVTPDFRLNLPLILAKRKDGSMIFYRCNDEQLKEKLKGDPCIHMTIIISWIECKAFFASLECHQKYYNEQYYSYINRFGNGLVLYKYGFVTDQIVDNSFQNLIISQDMPPFG